MTIKIQILAGVACGKTSVSRIVEKALRDAGFEVSNHDPDLKYQIDLEAAIKSASTRHAVEIETVQLSRPAMLQDTIRSP